MQIHIPDDLRQAVSSSISELQGRLAAPEEVTAVMYATAQVWASKWGARARRARMQLSAPLSAIHMSVVLQPLVNARMAFVSHSKDPRGSRTAASRMYVEAVVGLGESLVGNVPGQPLAFTAHAKELLRVLGPHASGPSTPDLRCLGVERGDPELGLVEWLQGLPEETRAAAACALQVESAPGKMWAVGPRQARGSSSADEQFYGLIARSASNMEDLAEFSGAGVFDSVPMAGVAYAAAWNGAILAEGLEGVEAAMLAIVLATVEVEMCMGEGDQDVEGVLDHCGHVHVVQARPQV